MKRILLLILFLIPACWSFAQGYIGRSKSQSKKALVTYQTTNKKIPTTLHETDSSLSLLIKDPTFGTLDIDFHFNRSHRCDREKRTSDCDSCFQKYLRETLAKQKFEWTKLSDSVYISPYPKKLVMQTMSGNGYYTYLIRKTNWNRKQYDALLRTHR
jgi:hypothetical protein